MPSETAEYRRLQAEYLRQGMSKAEIAEDQRLEKELAKEAKEEEDDEDDE